MSLSTIGSIATHIIENITVPIGISGNMVEIVDMARQHVSNYVGVEIGSNSIDSSYQPSIVDFAKADTLDLVNADSGGADLKLGELSISDTGQDLSSKQLRLMGEMKLKTLGRKINYSRSIS